MVGEAGEGVEFGDGDLFGRSGWREEVEGGSREHGFAGAGGSGEEEIVVAGDGDSEGALGDGLAVDVVEEWAGRGCGIFYNRRCGGLRQGFDAFEMEEECAEVLDAEDLAVGDELGLSEVLIGDEDLVEAMVAGGLDDVDDAADGTDGASEGKFADEETAGGVGGEKLVAEGEDGEGDRKVEVGAVFEELGGSEVDGDFGVGELKARIDNGATDALAALVDGFVGHADDAEVRQAAVGVAFDGDDLAVVAGGDSGEDLAGHEGSKT